LRSPTPLLFLGLDFLEFVFGAATYSTDKLGRELLEGDPSRDFVGGVTQLRIIDPTTTGTSIFYDFCHGFSSYVRF
jgi:hypothetical protein